MSKLSIELSEEELEILEKRGKDNFLSTKEQAEDIVRRSLVSYSKRKGVKKIKIDDKLVAAFSRDKRGRKKK